MLKISEEDMAPIFTIGYEGTDLDSFVETLKAVGVDCLADVRAVPISRKKGFSKKALSARLEREGIRYIHFVGLGNPKSGRDAAKAGHYLRFKKIFESHMMTDGARASLKEVMAIANARLTCLLCFERDPRLCHRSIVAAEMSEYGFEVFDLFGDDPARYVRNASRVPRYHPREGATAA